MKYLKGHARRDSPSVIMETYLKQLHAAKPPRRKVLLQEAKPAVIRMLSNCALNILKGSILLTQQEKKRLRPHKKKLRTLANKRTSLKTKKKILQQGGFLPPFLFPILAAIGGNIAGAVMRKIVK